MAAPKDAPYLEILSIAISPRDRKAVAYALGKRYATVEEVEAMIRGVWREWAEEHAAMAERNE